MGARRQKAGVPPRANVTDPAWPRAPYGLRFGASRAQMLASSIPTREDVSGFIKDLNRAKQTNRELHSQRCDFLIKLQVAKEMRDEKRIYFPHNIDFRGRAYTMHVHLNHLGSDVCRGALMFAEERLLGPDGLKWLRVQAANLYGGGVDKLPMDERARWIADRHDVVRAAAEDPLSDRGSFWLDAEDPWQCLATCLEIDAAVKSGNPETYQCRLPVHQDGSCNGLQHYAALGRDEAGGEQVNLMPRDRPGDVYTGIANVLRKIVAEDELSAPDPETRRLASLLAPHIDRKLVKQTVMTSVYGVTHVGARQQIQNRLKERGAIDDENARYQVATYAASRTLDALSNLFVNARDVMAWLAESARAPRRGARESRRVDHADGFARRAAVPREGPQSHTDAGAVVRVAVRQRREQSAEEQAEERVPAQLYSQRGQRAHDEDGGGVPRRGTRLRRRARLVLDARRRRAGDVEAHPREVHRAAQRAAARAVVRRAEAEVPGDRHGAAAAAAAGEHGPAERARKPALLLVSSYAYRRRYLVNTHRKNAKCSVARARRFSSARTPGSSHRVSDARYRRPVPRLVPVEPPTRRTSACASRRSLDRCVFRHRSRDAEARAPFTLAPSICRASSPLLVLLALVHARLRGARRRVADRLRRTQSHRALSGGATVGALCAVSNCERSGPVPSTPPGGKFARFGPYDTRLVYLEGEQTSAYGFPSAVVACPVLPLDAKNARGPARGPARAGKSTFPR